jgi:hypothetical protein
MKRILLTLMIIVSAFFGYSQTTTNTIQPVFPDEGYRFGFTEIVSVMWAPFERFINTDMDVYYTITVVKINEGQTKEDAIINNEPIYFREFTMPAAANDINIAERLDDSGSFPVSSNIAWQVSGKGIEDDVLYFDNGPISTFKTRLIAYQISAAGNYVKLTDSNDDLNHFSGSGYWIYYPKTYPSGEKLADTLYTSFDNLRINNTGGYFYLDSGRIEFKVPNTVSVPFFFDSNESRFEYDEVVIVREGARMIGSFEAFLPLKESNYPILLENEHSEIVFANDLYGRIPIKEQLINLQDNDITLKLFSNSLVYIQEGSSIDDNNYRFALDVGYSFPNVNSLKNDEPYFFRILAGINSASDEEKIFYGNLSQSSLFNSSDTLEFLPGSGLTFRPWAGILDMSDNQSPEGIDDPAWHGVTFSNISLYHPAAFGDLQFINHPSFRNYDKSIGFSIGPLGYSATLTIPFGPGPFGEQEHLTTLHGDTLILSKAYYDVKNNEIISAYVEGEGRVPFFNPNNEIYGFKYFFTEDGWGKKTTFSINEFEFLNAPSAIGQPVETRAHHVVLQWPEVEGATSYIVSVSQDYFQNTLENYTAVEVTEPTLLVDSLDADTTYQYSVKPIVPGLENYYAYPAEFSTAIEVPLVPNGFRLKKEISTIHLFWVDNQTEEGYIIERITADGETFMVVDSVSQDTTTFSEPIDFSLDPIAYRIAAYNAGGQGPYSFVASIKTGIHGEDLKKLGITMFPNPSSELVTINSPKALHAVSIKNINGQSIYKAELSQPTNNFELNIQHYQKGLYVVMIQLKDGAIGTARLIKE